MQRNRRGPRQLKDAVSELIAIRGLDRPQGDHTLRKAWETVAGERIARVTRVKSLRGGVLNIGVANSAMLGELVSFHRVSLLQEFRDNHSELRVRDIRFRLSGS